MSQSNDHSFIWSVHESINQVVNYPISQFRHLYCKAVPLPSGRGMPTHLLQVANHVRCLRLKKTVWEAVLLTSHVWL